jgi:homoserine dehydrogenase
MINLRLALLGLGNVGQAFVRLLAHKINAINEYDVSIELVGVATKTHGMATNAAGIDTRRLLETYHSAQSLEKFHTDKRITDSLEFIQKVDADILIECITLTPETGQPTVDYLQAALKKGMHVITTNKSAPAFAHHQLSSLAQQQGRAFLFEGTVLDGVPVFSFVRDTLPATDILGFRGVFNSTTNFILTSMEEGLPLEDALRQAQALGIPEKNPDYDLDGWDAAAKTAILVNALMDGQTTPPEIARTGIRHLTTRTVIEATRQGRRFKLMAEARWRDGHVVARIVPRMLSLNDPLAHVSGTSAAITLITDTLGEVTIRLNEGEVPQTAYAILADLMTIVKTHYAT